MLCFKLKFYVSGVKSDVQLDVLIIKNCRSLAHHIFELSSATQMLFIKLEEVLRMLLMSKNMTGKISEL